MKVDLIVRVMKIGRTSPVVLQTLKVQGRNKTELKKTTENIRGYFNRLYPDYKTYFTKEIKTER